MIRKTQLETEPAVSTDTGKVIYKYEVDAISTKYLPASARVVHVGQQKGVVMVWAEVDPSDTGVSRKLTIVGTGMRYPRLWRHLGTVQMPDGFVWHVMEVP